MQQQKQAWDFVMAAWGLIADADLDIEGGMRWMPKLLRTTIAPVKHLVLLRSRKAILRMRGGRVDAEAAEWAQRRTSEENFAMIHSFLGQRQMARRVRNEIR